jgi:hypothetical protein
VTERDFIRTNEYQRSGRPRNSEFAASPPLRISVGAFPFTPRLARRRARAVADPGAYTAHVSGTGDSTGNALVEISELP